MTLGEMGVALAAFAFFFLMRVYFTRTRMGLSPFRGAVGLGTLLVCTGFIAAAVNMRTDVPPLDRELKTMGTLALAAAFWFFMIMKSKVSRPAAPRPVQKTLPQPVDEVQAWCQKHGIPAQREPPGAPSGRCYEVQQQKPP